MNPKPAATITTLFSIGSRGLYTTIAIGADGLGFTSSTGGPGIGVAHCSDLACTAAIFTTQDFVGTQTSVVIGIDGMPLISYFGGTSDLMVIHSSNIFGIPYV